MSLNLRNLDFAPKIMPAEGVDLEVSFEGKTKFAPKIVVKYAVSKPFKFVATEGSRGTISPAGTVYTEEFDVPSKLYNPYPSELSIRRDPKGGGEDLRVLDVAMRAKELEEGFPSEWESGPAIRVVIQAALKELRRDDKGLSQAKLAELVDLHPSTIARAERGESVSKETMDKLHEHLS